MMEGVARDVLRQYFRVLKKDPTVAKPQPVLDAEELLGDEVVQEIKEVIDNE